MEGRILFRGVTSCLVVTAGSVDSDDLGGKSDNGERIESSADAPSFDVNDEADGKFLLLRKQPQEPADITEGMRMRACAYLRREGREMRRQDSRHLWSHSTQVNSRTS